MTFSASSSGIGQEPVTGPGSDLCVEVGILTSGKPTLSMMLTSLLLQDNANLRIHIVDTSENPVIKRDDVAFALRLAFDRSISCEYEVSREKRRAFSMGRLKLLEALKGPHTCFVDDDIVLPSSTFRRLAALIQENGIYGYIAPYCKNTGAASQRLVGSDRYSPGGVFYQDQLVRDVLLEYYSTTVDVLDKRKASDKVWEIAFLSQLFAQLGRKCIVQEDNVVYHLDYRERPNWNLMGPHLVGTSARKARELLSRHGILAGKAALRE
ncbi:MAG: glycosyltransferase family 2 protein [Chloroflexi bacterium]|nr:glycosyltransferase family 2 protein [Chloroflexota bacterium]